MRSRSRTNPANPEPPPKAGLIRHPARVLTSPCPLPSGR